MTELFPSPSLAIISNLGPTEIGLIVLLVLLLFGGRKLPELARGAGKAIKEFRSASSEAEKTFKDAMKEPQQRPEQTVQQTAQPEQSKARQEETVEPAKS